ncbi:hypothetical protein F1880_000156 [Penicillium rolfsii]|nr:hypothetical protein F1880_000156 [Penicillium rolfsii]
MSQSNSKSKGQRTTWREPVKPKPQTGWIWPKDPRPGNPTRWSRFKRFSDVLTGKGPDIFVGTIGKRPPPVKDNDNPGRTVSSTNWARWDVEPEEDDTPFPLASRPKNVKYDYKTRKYKVPDENTWSAVEYADCEWECGKNRRKKKVTPTTPIRFWDRHGRVHWCQQMEVKVETEDVMGIVVVDFISMTRRWEAMSICMGIHILFGVIVLIVDL